MVFVMPSPAIIEPTVIETIGGPSFFVDGCHRVRKPDVMCIICYVEHMVGDHVERMEVVRLIMGRRSYAEQLTLAYSKLREGAH